MKYCPTWSRLDRTERFAGLSLVFLTFIVVGYFSYIASEENVIVLIKKIGVGALLTVVGVTLWGCWSIGSEWYNARANSDWRLYIKNRSASIIVFFACVFVAWSAFPPANRTQMDEIVVLSTSRAIHEEKEPVTPALLQPMHGVNKLAKAFIDKRPYLYAALVALAHDLNGYSPRNAFYVNMCLAVMALAMAGIAGARLGGSLNAGIVAMTALTAVPLFCEHATGGGIDMLNLTMILQVFLIAGWHVEHPSYGSSRALLGATVLLAYSRYESLLYAGLTALIFLIIFRRTKRLFIDWSVVPLAVGVLPLAGIHFLTFSRSGQFFQLEDKGVSDAFSLKFIPQNLEHAAAFFLDQEHMLTNSPLVFVVGLIAFVLLLVTQFRKWREYVDSGIHLCFWGLAGIVIVAFVLLMAYSWGQLDEPVGSRLSLPFYLLMGLSVAFVARDFRRWRYFNVVLSALFVCGIYWSVFPVAAKQYGRKLYPMGQVIEAYDAFIKTQPDNRFMVISGATNYWLTRDVYAMPAKALQENLEYLKFLLKSHEYRRIYLIQDFRKDEKGEYTLGKNDAMEVTLDTELMCDDVIADLRRIKIYLVKQSSVDAIEQYQKRNRVTAPGGTKPVQPNAGIGD